MLFAATDIDRRNIGYLVTFGMIPAFFRFYKSVVENLEYIYDDVDIKSWLPSLKIIIVFVFLCFISVMAAYVMAMHYRLNTSVKEVKIIMQKDTISTNKDLRFIGKTKNYTIFYNLKYKNSFIYSNGEIKKHILVPVLITQHKLKKMLVYRIGFMKKQKLFRM